MECVHVDEIEASQILKELNLKWDAEEQSIVSFEVQYRRCAVAYQNFRTFFAADVVHWVQSLEDDKKSIDLFEFFIDKLIDPNSFHKEDTTDTQTFRQQSISNNTFRSCKPKRWEQSVFSGGYEVGGKKIPDLLLFHYMDNEKYVDSTQLNKEIKIGNAANFHLQFAYLMDFLQQPIDCIDWKEPQIFRDQRDPNIVFIESHSNIYKIDRQRGILLQTTKTRDGIVYEQVFSFEFFSPVDNLWFPRTVLVISYIPQSVVIVDGDATKWIPYFAKLHTIKDIKINEPMQEESFFIPASRGTIVWDYRDNLNNPLIMQADEDISDVIGWIDGFKVQPIPQTSRLLVLVLHIISIILLVVLFYWRYRKRNRG
jgi:hypothetical protein